MRIFSFFLMAFFTGALLAAPACASAPGGAAAKTAAVKSLGLLGRPATPVSEKEAMAWYNHCAEDKISKVSLTKLEKEALCSCAAMGLRAEMTDEDLFRMKDITKPIGQAAMTKMLEKVYLPCAFLPLRATIVRECEGRLSGTQNKDQVPRVCGCVADRTMAYVTKVGPSEAVYRMRLYGGAAADLFDVLRSGSGYTNALTRAHDECFYGR